MLESVSSFTKRQWIEYLFLLFVGVSITSAFFVIWFSPVNIPHQFSGTLRVIDITIFILLSYVVWYQIINEIFNWYIAAFMRRPVFMSPEKNKRVAFLTAFVPESEPYEMLEQTLKAMKAADYPHDTWVLDEGDDEKVKKICKTLGVFHFSRKGIKAFNQSDGPYKSKTKGGNFNSWFHMYGHKYDYVAQVDVDFIPKKQYLTRTLGYFKDPDVAFVGTPQIYGNTHESFVVKGAAEQAYGFYGSIQQGLFGLGMQLFIGANHVVRVAAHDDIEGYSGHIVEDHLTGMRFYSRRWKSVYVPEILAIGEGPSSWSAYFSQQMRWSYGLIDILFRHSPNIVGKLKRIHAANYLWLQQYYFFGLAQVIGLFLLLLYFVFGIQSTLIPLSHMLTVYIPLLLVQVIIQLWLQQFNIDPEKEKGLLLYGKIISWAAWPIYFLAYVSVLLQKRLTYKVTPKGSLSSDKKEHSLHLFFPHAILGTVSFICIAASIITGNKAPQLLFFAYLNTCMMYAFVIAEGIKNIRVFFRLLFDNKRLIKIRTTM